MNALEALLQMADGYKAMEAACRTLVKTLDNVADQTIGIPVTDPVVYKTEAKETKKPEKVEKQEESTVSIDEVRAVLADLSQNGHTADVKKLLADHGAQKLSSVDPGEYAALLEEASKIK